MADAPRVPVGLKGRGRALWLELQEAYEWDGHEAALLLEVCRTLVTLDALDAVVRRDGMTTLGSTGQVVVHPAVLELRQQRATYARLIAQLNLEDDEGAALTPRQAAAQRAAQRRWAEGKVPRATAS